jgi:sterol desaturase/sphingolipid hydroxylase (fatty acid hydroxylase superfamily)
MNGNALSFALTTCAALLASHLLTAIYIAKNDLSGNWKAFSLKRSSNTLSTYTQHLPSLLYDVTVLLLPALYFFAVLREDALLNFSCDSWAEFAQVAVVGLAKAVICNLINRMWAMLAHRLFHVSPTLYKMVHKRHHCGLKDMCATSGWQDTNLEFIFMEVLGVFVFAPLVFPVLCAPWPFHVLLAIYNGAGAAIDHSGFYVPGTLIDGRYHLVHHRDLYYNYAEMETLDWIFGTLRHYEAPVQAASPLSAKPSSPIAENSCTTIFQSSPLLRSTEVVAPCSPVDHKSTEHGT